MSPAAVLAVATAALGAVLAAAAAPNVAVSDGDSALGGGGGGGGDAGADAAVMGCDGGQGGDEQCRGNDGALHLLQKRRAGLTTALAVEHPACQNKHLCNPKKVVFKIDINTSGAVEGSEVAYAQTLVQKLADFLRHSNATMQPALSSEALEKEPARFVEFLDTPPPQFALRRGGWIVRHRSPVPGAEDSGVSEDLCIKRRSKLDPKEHPEEADRMLAAEGVKARYSSKEQWIAGSDRPSFQLYSCFKGKLFGDLEMSGFDLSAQQTTQQWSRLVPALGDTVDVNGSDIEVAGSQGQGPAVVGPNGLTIRQEEVPLAAGHFISADGEEFKFKPSVIFWFDQADVQPRTAFTGELTWDLKLKKHSNQAERARLAIFEPLVAFLGDLVVDGSKTTQAYARMRTPMVA